MASWAFWLVAFAFIAAALASRASAADDRCVNWCNAQYLQGSKNPFWNDINSQGQQLRSDPEKHEWKIDGIKGTIASPLNFTFADKTDTKAIQTCSCETNVYLVENQQPSTKPHLVRRCYIFETTQPSFSAPKADYSGSACNQAVEKSISPARNAATAINAAEREMGALEDELKNIKARIKGHVTSLNGTLAQDDRIQFSNLETKEQKTVLDAYNGLEAEKGNINRLIERLDNQIQGQKQGNVKFDCISSAADKINRRIGSRQNSFSSVQQALIVATSELHPYSERAQGRYAMTPEQKDALFEGPEGRKALEALESNSRAMAEAIRNRISTSAQLRSAAENPEASAQLNRLENLAAKYDAAANESHSLLNRGTLMRGRDAAALFQKYEPQLDASIMDQSYDGNKVQPGEVSPRVDTLFSVIDPGIAPNNATPPTTVAAPGVGGNPSSPEGLERQNGVASATPNQGADIEQAIERELALAQKAAPESAGENEAGQTIAIEEAAGDPCANTIAIQLVRQAQQATKTKRRDEIATWINTHPDQRAKAVETYGCKGVKSSAENWGRVVEGVNAAGTVAAGVAGGMAYSRVEQAAADGENVHATSYEEMGSAMQKTGGGQLGIGAMQYLIGMKVASNAKEQAKAAEETLALKAAQTEVAKTKAANVRFNVGALTQAIESGEEVDNAAGTRLVTEAAMENQRAADAAAQVADGAKKSALTNVVNGALLWWQGREMKKISEIFNHEEITPPEVAPGNDTTPPDPIAPGFGDPYAGTTENNVVASTDPEGDPNAPLEVPAPLADGGGTGGLKDAPVPLSNNMIGPPTSSGGGGGGGGFGGGGGGEGGGAAGEGEEGLASAGGTAKFEAAGSGGGGGGGLFGGAATGGSGRVAKTGDMDFGKLLEQFMPGKEQEGKGPAGRNLQFALNEGRGLASADAQDDGSILGRNANLFIRVSNTMMNNYKRGNLR